MRQAVRPGERSGAKYLSTTVVSANNTRSVEHTTADGNDKYDCFYLYPTASTESPVNADLVVRPAEISVAMAQTARFSQVCDVWAPMYRQITVHAIFGGTRPDASTITHNSVLSASIA
jgi:Protein of unknown function (DUF3089)